MNSAQNSIQKNEKSFTMNKEGKRRSWFIWLPALVLFAVVVACLGIFAAVEIWPSIGAQTANQTRKLIGPQAVAQIEALVFQAQDRIKLWVYQFGVEEASAPWTNEESTPEGTPAAQIPSNITTQTLEATNLKETSSIDTETLSILDETEVPTKQRMIKTATLTPSPTPYVWQLSNLVPFGSLEGEGAWLPYLNDGQGNVVARRTFLQPDPERPYTIVAVVAFDLTRSRLHFVLGFLEPSLPGGPKGTGLIPKEDREAGKLLATFNGGFRSANGQFGAMSEGIVALPAKDDIATLGIYRDGTLRIGNWGEDIIDSPDLESWRQNCRLIIQDGEISPRVYNDSITDWGASISNEIVTRRSGIGLDQDAKTLYYFAGSSLSMPTLADAMLTTGVYNGMLLDINNFWVLFSAIQFVEDNLIADPLLPNEMKDKVDRYLGASPDDFFYVTAIDTLKP